MDSVLVETRAGEGGNDAKDLVIDQFGIYQPEGEYSEASLTSN